MASALSPARDRGAFGPPGLGVGMTQPGTAHRGGGPQGRRRSRLAHAGVIAMSVPSTGLVVASDLTGMVWAGFVGAGPAPVCCPPGGTRRRVTDGGDQQAAHGEGRTRALSHSCGTNRREATDLSSGGRTAPSCKVELVAAQDSPAERTAWHWELVLELRQVPGSALVECLVVGTWEVFSSPVDR
jgi:hypothetical protein